MKTAQDELKDEFSENGETEFEEKSGSEDEYENIDVSEYVQEGDDEVADYGLRDDNYSDEEQKQIPFKTETSFYEMLTQPVGHAEAG